MQHSNVSSTVVSTPYHLFEGLLTMAYLTIGNGTYAAGAAAAMVNVVALAYIMAASLEDKSEKPKKE